MRKYRYLSSAALCFMLVVFTPLQVYANSSWRWISETRPYDVLPFVIIITLAVETLALYYFASVRQFSKTLWFVILGNLCSFAAPYGFRYMICLYEQLYTFTQALEHLPVYIVGVGYLIVTLIIEIPIVYCALKKHTTAKKLLPTILIANIITTVFTAIVERIFCQGRW